MTSLTAILGIALSSHAPAQTGVQPDPNFLDWTAVTSVGGVNSRIGLKLKNLGSKEFLTYGSRTWGINLVWSKNPSFDNVFFAKPNPGKPDPAFGFIAYAAPVALYVVNGGYLKYESRSVGVNLGWSSKPVYEWYIVGLADAGKQLRAGVSFGLLNERTKDFLIYHERSAGINLGWAKDDKSVSWNAEGRRFIKMLRDRQFTKMADFLKQKLDW